MEYERLFFVFIIVMIVCMVLFRDSRGQKNMMNAGYSLTTMQSLCALLPSDIAIKTEAVIKDAQDKINAIIAIEPEKRTYYNVAQPLDYVCSISDYAIVMNVVQLLEMVSPDKEVRDAAHKAIIAMQEFGIDQISTNKKLYQVFKEYVDFVSDKELLTEQQSYFIKNTLQDFERAGLGLSGHQLEVLSTLKKEIAQLCLEFETNIAADSTKLLVSVDELKGLSQAALDLLPQKSDGLYEVGLDYPTVDAILQYCQVEQTRKKVAIAFSNRAYPKNETVLRSIVAKRDELARLLGYPSYAHFDLENQMVLSPERALAFLYDLHAKATAKVYKEFDLLLQEVPQSVELLSDGKVKPWDVSFIRESYKKKHFNLDQEILAEYFPMERTIEGLLNVYRSFLGIEFKQVSVSGYWHSDVKGIQVYNSDNKLLGTLLLDLHPRAYKYNHACELTVIPSIVKNDGTSLPGLCVVIANFPKATAEKPALLKLNDVNTFFHEFGHALHALLGATTIASFSGTNTKSDFVELPSQILEEWLDDKVILTMISNHYLTGESLPEKMIDTIVALKKFSGGTFVQRQIYLALLSLELYMPGQQKDPRALMNKIHGDFVTYTIQSPEDHFYASFGHLTGYAAKYYGYLWSKVFALDMFNAIKQRGLLNPEVGKEYISLVLAQGGSKDPEVLLESFLGRQPNNKAFLKSLGLDQEIVLEDSINVSQQANT